MSKAQLFCLVNQTNVLWTCHKACKIEFSDCCYCLCSVCYASKVDEDDKKQEHVLKKSRKRRGGTRNFDDDLILYNHGIDALVPLMDQTFFLLNTNKLYDRKSINCH